MYLGGLQQGFSRSINSYFSDLKLPKQIEEGTLEILVIRLKNGDQSAAIEIINGHIRLAISIATRYSLLDSDDIVSAAMYGVCQAVKWAPTRLKDLNITPYIVSTVHRFISDCHEEDDVVHIPKGIRKDFFFDYVSWAPERNADCDIFIDEEEHGPDVLIPVIHDDLFNIDGAIDDLDLPKQHGLVLKLKLEGYTHAQIGQKLEIKKRDITRIFVRIEECARACGLEPIQEPMERRL